MLDEGGYNICTYDEAMKMLYSYLNDDNLLIGHNIQSDINFLNLDISGLRLWDTQKNEAYRYHGLPNLPGLAKTLLRYYNINIHDGSHDSLVDARASMLIYRSEIDLNDDCN